MDPWTLAHLFGVNVLHVSVLNVDAILVNYTANRFKGSRGHAQTYSLSPTIYRAVILP